MIKNDRAYRVTKKAAATFEQSLLAHEAKPTETSGSSISHAAELSALRAQLADLKNQIAEYEQLRAGDVEEVSVSKLEDLPSAIIRARIAEGLSHEQLAARVGVKPQQIQRWEEEDYQSTAFWRLIEVAEALGLTLEIKARLPQRSVPDIAMVVDKLRKVGVDKVFLEKSLIPVQQGTESRERARVFSERFTAVFNSSISSWIATNDDVLRGRTAVANARFKIPSRAKEGNVAVHSSYAYFLSSALCEARSSEKKSDLPSDWRAMRDLLFGKNKPDLRTAVTRFWDAGVTVLPLSGKGGPLGACWKIRGRSAMVIKQPVRTASRWLFDVLHEGHHLAEAAGREEFVKLEEEGTAPERRLSQDELKAHAFAADVLLSGRADTLYKAVMAKTGSQVSRMKQALRHVAEQEGVEADFLANHVAFSCWKDSGLNVWGLAQSFQNTSVDPFKVVREVLLERVDVNTIPEPAAGLLTQALD